VKLLISIVSLYKTFTNAGAEIQYFGAGEDPISLYYVVCNGDEQQLTNCNYSHHNMDYCRHTADIGVVCQAPGEIRVLHVMICA